MSFVHKGKSGNIFCNISIGMNFFISNPTETKLTRKFSVESLFSSSHKLFNSFFNNFFEFIASHWLTKIFSGSTHLLCSLMRSTSRSTASASGMLNLIGVLPT